jgi:starch synthase
MARSSASPPDDTDDGGSAGTALAGGMSVVHLVAEYFPYARSGGLAEAVRGIASFQAKEGVPTVVLLPLYRIARARAEKLTPIGDPIEVALGPARDRVQLWDANEPAPGPRVVFVDHPGLFDRDGLYGEHGRDYDDNHIRFAFFVKAACVAIG